MKYIYISKLDKYQQYREGRNIIWIKWYLKCLSDFNFCQLKDREKWLFIGLIMLSMESGGTGIPLDPFWIRGRVCAVPSDGGGEGVSGVRVSIEKMAKLKLIEIKNVRIDKIREDKIRKEDNYNNLPNYLRPVKRVLEEHLKK